MEQKIQTTVSYKNLLAELNQQNADDGFDITKKKTVGYYLENKRWRLRHYVGQNLQKNQSVFLSQGYKDDHRYQPLLACLNQQNAAFDNNLSSSNNSTITNNSNLTTTTMIFVDHHIIIMFFFLLFCCCINHCCAIVIERILSSHSLIIISDFFDEIVSPMLCQCY